MIVNYDRNMFIAQTTNAYFLKLLSQLQCFSKNKLESLALGKTYKHSLTFVRPGAVFTTPNKPNKLECYITLDWKDRYKHSSLLGPIRRLWRKWSVVNTAQGVVLIKLFWHKSTHTKLDHLINISYMCCTPMKRSILQKE
jgi:hypothetical protein